MFSKTTITFNSEEVRQHLVQAIKSPAHMPTISELTDPQYLRPGTKPAGAGFPNLSAIDLSKIGPRLWLCSDHFIYLLHNGKPVIGDTTSALPPAYALETDPLRYDFPTCQKNAERLLGKGTQWISIPVKPLIKAIRRSSTVRVEVRRSEPGPMMKAFQAACRAMGLSDVAFTLVIPYRAQ